MKVIRTALPGVLQVEPDVFGDARGFFLETYRLSRYSEAGMHDTYVQDNVSRSQYGVLRGLHLQNPNCQAKLVHVLEGEVFDVAVDVRVGSPHFGKWVGMLLSGESKHQLYIPEGFAHGFCVTSETALFAYKCSAAYDAASELAIRWDDPEIGIEWPLAQPQLSEKDAGAPRLSEVERARLPVYPG